MSETQQHGMNQQEVDHANAILSPRDGYEKGIIMMLDGIQIYMEQYHKEMEATVGKDFVVGEGCSDIVHGLHTLLNGPTGRLDCGTLSHKLDKLFIDHDLEL